MKIPQKKMAEKSDNITGRNKSKNIGERREIIKILALGQTIQTRNSKITKENSTNNVGVESTRIDQQPDAKETT